MHNNIFTEAAAYARFYAPSELNILIAPIERLPEIGSDIMALSKYPVLYVTRTGYIPFATKSEILRRCTANLFLLGGEESISEWVEYALSTLTQGGVYRILKCRTTNENRQNLFKDNEKADIIYG